MYGFAYHSTCLTFMVTFLLVVFLCWLCCHPYHARIVVSLNFRCLKPLGLDNICLSRLWSVQVRTVFLPFHYFRVHLFLKTRERERSGREQRERRVLVGGLDRGVGFTVLCAK